MHGLVCRRAWCSAHRSNRTGYDDVPRSRDWDAFGHVVTETTVSGMAGRIDLHDFRIDAQRDLAFLWRATSKHYWFTVFADLLGDSYDF